MRATKQQRLIAGLEKCGASIIEINGTWTVMQTPNGTKLFVSESGDCLRQNSKTGPLREALRQTLLTHPSRLRKELS